MITFKEFLWEEAVTPLKRQPVSIDELNDRLRHHCYDALLDFFTGAGCLYRGWKRAETPAMIDTTVSRRKSENTSNHYTLLLDSNPDNVGFPKRDGSLICSTSKNRAAIYGELTLVLPFDGTVIGSINDDDIWETGFLFENTFFAMPDNNDSILYLIDYVVDGDLAPNNITADMRNNITYDSFKKLLDYLDATQNLKDALNNAFKLKLDSDSRVKAFKDAWLRSYSYEGIGATTTTDISKIKKSSEVWFSGKCYVIPYHLIDRIKKL